MSAEEGGGGQMRADDSSGLNDALLLKDLLRKSYFLKDLLRKSYFLKDLLRKSSLKCQYVTKPMK